MSLTCWKRTGSPAKPNGENPPGPQRTPGPAQRAIRSRSPHRRLPGLEQLENGDLLEAAASHGYDLFITCDQGMRYEQNLGRYDVTVLTIMRGDWNLIRQNIDLVREAMRTAVRGEANPVHLRPQA